MLLLCIAAYPSIYTERRTPMLPASLQAALQSTLGDNLRTIRLLGASDWSMAACVESQGQRFVVKWATNATAPPPGWPSLLAAEAYGLRMLNGAQAIKVPHVYVHAEHHAAHPAYLAVEWIDSPSKTDRQSIGQKFGEQLATLHRTSAESFGLDQHNYCGATPQFNTPMASWIEFYGNQRLGFQMKLAAHNGRLPSIRQQRLESLIDRLDQWIDDQAVQPALIHGDLWSGNFLVDASGSPALIDPAIYFADREAELAMCHLFGGFPDTFYLAYDDAWPPAPGRDARIPLYQLYHLLNHLNLFGESYGGQVDRVLQRYVG